jgi:hypothetical protein
MRSPTFGVTLLATLALSGACSTSSGSTGTTGGTTTTTGGSNTGGSYTLSPTSLSFSATADNPAPPAQNVQVSVQGAVYLMTSFTGTAVASATVIADGGSTATIAIAVINPAQAETLTDRVDVIGCEDAFCMFKLADSPQYVDVTYTIAPGGLATAPSQLNFLETIGLAPPNQDIQLHDIADASYPWAASLSYDNPSQGGWLSIAPDGGSALPETVTVGVIAASSPGTRSATISFFKPTAAFAVSPVLVIDVANAPVSGIAVQPASIDVSSARGTAPTSATFTLNDLDGGSYAWTASVEPLPNEAEGFITASPLLGNSLPATVTVSFAAMNVVGTNSEVLHFSGNGSDQRALISYRSY